jgi:hypothetical protein
MGGVTPAGHRPPARPEIENRFLPGKRFFLKKSRGVPRLEKGAHMTGCASLWTDKSLLFHGNQFLFCNPDANG